MKVFHNFDLTSFNSYNIQASCKTAYFPERIEDLKIIYSSVAKPILLGSGHNVIFSKEYYDESFIILNDNFNNIELHDNIVIAEAGAWMSNLSKKAFEHSLSGIEVFCDIPSSLGGAIVMNAGASGEEIKDVLVKVEYLDLEDFSIKTIEKNDMSFEYRNSFFQKNTNKIVLKAWLALNPKEKEEIGIKMENIKAARWLKQPKTFPNAGSVFKRPTGYYVGALIEELNLKGFTVGGAKISNKHGGFIINYNNASGNDILEIIKHVKKLVIDKYNVDLEVEQRII